MKRYSIGQFADQLGITIQTLRNWDKTNKLKPEFVSPSGHRYYSQKQLDYFLGLHKPNTEERIIVGYCSVSSHKQKDDLERQVESTKLYLTQQGKPFEVIRDIGNDLDYNKKGLNRLIDMVLNHKVNSVVVLRKDRLLRFGFELLENLFGKYGVPIQIIDNTPKTETPELIEDLIQIITLYSSRLQGSHVNKAKEIIKELRENDFSEKS